MHKSLVFGLWSNMQLPQIKLPKFGGLKLKAPANPTAGLSGAISKWKKKFPFFTKKGSTLILEIGEDWLKMLAVNQGKEKQLKGAEAASITGFTEIQKSEKISQFLKKYELKPNQTVILHPSQNLTSRILSLPSTDPNEIRDIIALQAVKQTPYSKEEICTGFHIIDTDPTGYSRVLLAISHRDVASAYFRTGEYSGLTADQINISVEGVRSWFEAAKLAKENEACALMDVDWASTELLILQGAKLIYSRSISFGMKHIEEKPQAVELDFFPELQRSLEASAGDLKGAAIARIYITGMNPKIQEMLPILSRELNLPCEAILNFKPFPEISKDVSDALAQSSCSLAPLLGFALNPHPASINLIPPQIEAKKGLESRAKDLAILGSLFLALVTLASAISFEKIYKKHQYLNYLKTEYSAIQAPAEEVQRTVAKMKLASEQLNIGANFLDVLYDITDVLPPNIYLTLIQYNAAESNIVIRGIAEEMSSVFKLLSTMEAAAHLEYVKTRSVTKRKLEEKDVAEFEIYAEIADGKDHSAAAKDKKTDVPPAVGAQPKEPVASGTIEAENAANH